MAHSKRHPLGLIDSTYVILKKLSVRFNMPTTHVIRMALYALIKEHKLDIKEFE